jgi:hypothetical protein
MRRWAAVAVVAWLGACGGEVGDGGGVDAGDGGGGGAVDAGRPPDGSPWHEGMKLEERPCPPESIVSYQNFASGFLAEYCRGCHGGDVPKSMRHGAPLAVTFDEVGEVRQRAARIYARAGDGYATMPPAGGPSFEARELLGEWLACGAPE